MRVVVSRREALLGRDEREFKAQFHGIGPERVLNLMVGFELCYGHVEVKVSDFSAPHIARILILLVLYSQLFLQVCFFSNLR
ncbi:hypothetical protein PanWU01x14_343850 [Parasponia andersonii]|uniref:Uncharacterized protein n=1 Tax=Parasponia andersonii TaxID=3476 RepID=A0A2P5AD88_PARAD|nr:hypothetical protein PanWU01x14_343850 [Parasponia andersonii]